MIIIKKLSIKHPHYALRILKQTMDKLKYTASYDGSFANIEIEHLIKAHIRNFESEHGEILLEDLHLVQGRKYVIITNSNKTALSYIILISLFKDYVVNKIC